MEAVKTRYLILVWLVSPDLIPVDRIMDWFGIPYDGHWWDATYYYCFYLLLAIFLILHSKYDSPIGQNGTRDAPKLVS